MSRIVVRTLVVLLLGSACFSDQGSSETTDGVASTSTAASATSTSAPTTSSPGTSPTEVDPTGNTPTTGGEPSPFIFPTAPLDAYVQIDRHGAVEAGTAGILAAQGLGFNVGSDLALRDAYNASDPAADAAGTWTDEIVASMTFFHSALDDDMTALNLVPATLEDTLLQAGPVIIPDTIKYDPTRPTAYPNGRRLEDPVVDLTFAAVLLKLGPDQPLSLFADLPLNPPANDVPFKPEFPFLAAPHTR
jgi:hypothetical protein